MHDASLVLTRWDDVAGFSDAVEVDVVADVAAAFGGAVLLGLWSVDLW